MVLYMYVDLVSIQYITILTISSFNIFIVITVAVDHNVPGNMNVPPPHLQQQMGDKQLPSLLSLKVDPPEQILDGNSGEVVLPQVLEQVLALKNQRALELGTEDSNVDAVASKPESREKETVWDKEDNVVMSYLFSGLFIYFIYPLAKFSIQ